MLVLVPVPRGFAQSLPPNITESVFHMNLLMCCQIIGWSWTIRFEIHSASSSPCFHSEKSRKDFSKLSINRNIKSEMEMRLSLRDARERGKFNPNIKQFLINHFFIIIHFHSWMEFLKIIQTPNNWLPAIISSHLSQSKLTTSAAVFESIKPLFRLFSLNISRSIKPASNHYWLSRWCPIKMFVFLNKTFMQIGARKYFYALKPHLKISSEDAMEKVNEKLIMPVPK